MVLGGIVDFIRRNFGSPPNAYLFLVFISIITSVSYFLAQIFLVDRQKVKLYSERIRRWQEKRRKAMKTGSKRLLMEVQRESEIITKMQSEVAMEQFKPFLFLFIPFLLLFIIIQNAYGGKILVYLPYWLPIVGRGLNAVWVYIFLNFILSSIFNTVLKLYELRKEVG